MSWARCATLFFLSAPRECPPHFRAGRKPSTTRAQHHPACLQDKRRRFCDGCGKTAGESTASTTSGCAQDSSMARAPISKKQGGMNLNTKHMSHAMPEENINSKPK